MMRYRSSHLCNSSFLSPAHSLSLSLSLPEEEQAIRRCRDFCGPLDSLFVGPDHSRIPLLLSAPNTTDLPTFPLVSTSCSSFPVDCKVSSRGCGAGLNCHPPGLRLQVSFPLAVFSFQFLSSFLIPPTSPWAKQNPMFFFQTPFHDFLLSHPAPEGSWTRHSIPPSQFGFRWSTSSLISPFPPRPHTALWSCCTVLPQ